MIAAIYARKSTEQNGVADEQKSVTRQIENATGYAERKGWAVSADHVYIDDGISGAEFANRPGFLRLMNSLKPRAPFQVLIMSEESRLGRESIETAYALKQIMQAGVKVWCYLEDRERTLDSPTDKIMSALTGFADELEREKARQRTYDAMARMARAGHVTGGHVFGYDNLRVDSHVERRVHETEAAIVRRIFDLCASGLGLKRIAIRLNDEGALSPRAQQGRPRGWAPSSVREVLYRPLYRGEIVWNRTRKRNTWGVKQAQERAESDWIRRDAPELRIVTDDAWDAAHRRLGTAQRTYLRGTNGQLWGRPLTGIESKYLLTGLSRCGCCGGTLLVKTRAHGRKRAVRYGCSSYHLRGRAICTNAMEVSMTMADAAIIEAIRDDVLHPDVVRDAVQEAVQALTGTIEPEGDEAITRELDSLRDELARLTTALAAGGDLPALLGAIRERDMRRATLERQLAARMQARRAVARMPADVEQQLWKQLDDWRTMLGEETAWTRQFLQKLLVDKVMFVPTTQDGEPAYEMRARFHLGRFFSGILCPKGLASPTGFEPVFWP